MRGALETLRRLTQRINEVMRFAVHSGLLESNPASTIGEVFEKPKKQHMATIRPERLSELMQRVETTNLSLMTRYLLKWQLLTLVRPGEAAGARWCEIDTEKKLWTIPADRMKKRREHQVPLSPQALALLEQLKPLSRNSSLLFPGRIKRDQPMNSETVNKALRRMGYQGELVSHGFRALGSTTLNEAGFMPDVIDAALAHADRNQTRAAYNRSTYLMQRVEMITSTEDEIVISTPKVLTLNGGGSYLKLSQNGIEHGSVGDFIVKASQYQVPGMGATMPADKKEMTEADLAVDPGTSGKGYSQ